MANEPKVPASRVLGRRELEWLSGAVGFNTLPERPSLRELLGKLPSLELVAYPEGTEIIREGDVGEEFYVLYRGGASVEKEGRRVAELVPGDFFGEVGFLVHVARTATVRAGAGCEVFRVRGADFEIIVKRVTGLEATLRDVARQRMRKLADLGK